MNQRREMRFQANESVAITVLGEADIRFRGHMKNVSGRGIGLETEIPVVVGTAIKIELEDSLLLGEVIFCRQDEASFYVGVELEHALNGLAELSRIVSGFEEAANSRPQQAHSVTEGEYQNQQQTH